MDFKGMRRSTRTLVGLLLIAAVALFSQTLWAAVIQHSGPILQDTVWSKADQHLVVGDVTVYSQVTLTIEPGTTVRFAAQTDNTAGGTDTTRSELILDGALIADGTVANPITFTSDAATPAANDWGGIRHRSRFPLVLRHAVVEYGSVGVDYAVSGAVSASVTIEDSVIRHSSGTGISLQASDGATLAAAVRRNEVYDHSNGQGIYLSNNDSTLSATVTGNLVYATATGVYLYNYGTLSAMRIADNEIRNNTGDGIYLYAYYDNGTAATLYVDGNHVHDNSSNGLNLFNYQQNGLTAVIRGNEFVGNGNRGVYLYDYYYGRTVAQLNLNRIQGNGAGGIYASYLGGVDIIRNQVSGNPGGGIYLNALRAMARINFNDLGGDNGTYEVQNNDNRAVDARDNWWGAATAAEMAAGGNPKDIVRIDDIFNNNSYGAVDYGQWLAAVPVLNDDPVSWVKSPADGATLKAAVVRIEGSASAAQDIDRVEVSTDGGVTWVVAAGTLSWSYDWTVPGDGAYLLRSRIVTAGGVLESPGAGNRVTLNNSQPGTPGSLVEDETWGGELIITGDITVPAGVTLTIAPGSKITFSPNRDDLFGGSDQSRAELVVNGALIIQGTADAPVEITSDAPFPLEGDWAGIKVTGGVLDMQYATVEYAANGVSCEADGVPVRCTITDSTIRSNSGYGINAHVLRAGQLDLWLEKNEVSANLEGGAYLYTQGGSGNPRLSATLVANNFRNNSNYGVYAYTDNGAEAHVDFREDIFDGNGEGVYVYNYQASALSSYTLFGNDLGSNGTGLRYYNYYSAIDPEITNNFVHDNLSYGLHLSTAGSASLAPKLSGNTIIDNGQGIYSKATGVLTTTQNQFYGTCLSG